MALDDEKAGTTQEMCRTADWLRDCPDLAGVDSAALEALTAGVVHFSLPAGAVLFEAGADPDGVYLVASGRLGVRAPGHAALSAEIERGELVGEAGWLLKQTRSATLVALRDSELLFIPNTLMEHVTGQSPQFSLALARLCARRLRHSYRQDYKPKRARVFAVVPNSLDVDIAAFASQIVNELSVAGRTELVWDVRASDHSATWFNRIEENNDFVVYVANPRASGWTRQCCRQADVILLVACAAATPGPWPAGVAETAVARGARVELALLHTNPTHRGIAAAWLDVFPVSQHHHVGAAADISRIARLLTGRGVGLVLSGGGARGFAHLGVIRALREARVPVDFVGGASIGAVIAAGVAMRWDDEEMQQRYRRGFVDTNPVNDYTFPFIALTRGRKVSRLLEGEFGDIAIEDLPLPYFCISANLTTGRALEHRTGLVAQALRASVAIPGVMPPVFHPCGVLVDGAAINNMPVDVMQSHAPGIVIGCDVGADSSFGKRRVNIFQILVHAGMINSAQSAAAQRELADVVFKPPLPNVDLLNWRAFDAVIKAGYDYARVALVDMAEIPRILPSKPTSPKISSLAAELHKRLGATSPAG